MPEIMDIPRDEQYWYANGDIVLIANRKVAFKVYAEFLCRESTVFKDFIGRDVPQPAEQDTMDGCPIVDLTDEPEELKIFLSFIYDGWRFQKGNKHMTWSVVQVMIRLGDKYNSTELHEAGHELLRLTFPSNIDDWDTNEGIKYEREDLISMANITVKLDPDLHDVILHLCCSLPLPKLIAGLRDEGRGLHLTVLDRCLRIRERMPLVWSQTMDFIFTDQIEDCKNKQCTRAAKTFHALMKTAPYIAFPPQASAYNVLNTSTFAKMILDLEEKEVCGRCLNCYKEAFDAFRQSVRISCRPRSCTLIEEADET